MTSDADPAAEETDLAPRRGPARGLFVFALALAPTLAAIAAVPEFSTQDGPAHLYNARILAAALRPGSPYAGAYEVRWRPVPNWVGHLATMGAVEALPLDVAARAMTAATLIAFSGAVVWARWRVAGGRGLGRASVLATLLGLNVTWLLGFTSFLLGATLFPITLATWWDGRDRPGLARAASLAGLLVLGYFCHPISLGLTVVGLGVLALATPGPARLRWLRFAWTAASLIPLVPLGLAYAVITRSGGAMVPTWEQLDRGDFASFRGWVNQLAWVDPLSLAAKTIRPFGWMTSLWNGLLAPAAWTTIAVVIVAATTWNGRRPERRGWAILAALLLAGGVLGPDTLGERHGHYLPQRVALLGLVAAVPWLDLGSTRRASRLASGMMVVALVLQSAFVWDYAQDCRNRLEAFLRARPAIGANQRIGTLLVTVKGRFRSNPLLHADCLFGIDPPNIVWSNYETDHYYFPVRVRGDLDHPSAEAFEKVSIKDSPGDVEDRLRLWENLLREHHEQIDVLVEWGANPQLDAINERWFRVDTEIGAARTWTRREAP